MSAFGRRLLSLLLLTTSSAFAQEVYPLNEPASTMQHRLHTASSNRILTMKIKPTLPVAQTCLPKFIMAMDRNLISQWDIWFTLKNIPHTTILIGIFIWNF